MTGIYALIIKLCETKGILVGNRRRYHFRKGWYVYVGSALSGLEKRIRRHLSPEKKRHWHIDYLVEMAKIHNIIYAETKETKECALATLLSQKLPVVADFGCSDCRCRSHLFFCPEQKDPENITANAFRSLNLKPVSDATGTHLTQ